MKYTILKEASAEELSKKVLELINDDWISQGWVSTMFEDTVVNHSNHNGGLIKFRPNVEYVQAMIKQEQGSKF